MSQELQSWIKKVKYRLVDLNMSQADLARKINVSAAAISDLFKYGKGSQKIIERINGCLGIE